MCSCEEVRMVFFSSRRRHTRYWRDWSSDVCSSDLLAVGLVALLAAANLRGLRESGRTFAVPTYLFISGIMVMIVTGLVRDLFTGSPVVAESAGYAITPEPEFEQVTGLALVFFVLRAFASGCTALTGVEAIANGVPAFKPPKDRKSVV